MKDSAIYKASPLHKLTDEQEDAKIQILDCIASARNKNEKQIIFIDGEAGTGKTVLNSSIFYELYCQEEEKDNTETSDEPYYLNDETRLIAQEAFENPELRTLFHVARDIPPERLKAHIEFMKSLKAQEKGDPDEPC